MPRSDFCLFFALWPVRYIGWISVLLNLAMIAATPVDGSHYFSDVAAGLTIATLSWIAVSRFFAQIGLARANWLINVAKARDLPKTAGVLDT